MISRQELETESLATAGVKGVSGHYQWIRVLDSFEMYVLDSDKSVTPCLVRDGYWESWITAWMLNNLQDGTTFIDIGANAGYYAFIAKHQGSNVIAFEPNPAYADMMLATVKRNGWENIDIHTIALSNFTGDAVLSVPEDLHGSASLSHIPGYEITKIEVSVAPFDDVCINLDPEGTYMVKIDAESEEENIMHGMKDFLTRCHNVTVMMEYTPYAYTDKFLDYLFENWSVSRIENDGSDLPISHESIQERKDWSMLALKKRD